MKMINTHYGKLIPNGLKKTVVHPF